MNGTKRINQEVYLKALATTPTVETVLGHFKSKRVMCVHSHCTYPGKRIFTVPEEKHTDVNIAVYMLDDAYQELCDQIILVSGDSDLVPAVKMIRDRFPLIRIVVYVPALDPKRSTASELGSVAHKHSTIPNGMLRLAQFPNPVHDGVGGVLNKPPLW